MAFAPELTRHEPGSRLDTEKWRQGDVDGERLHAPQMPAWPSASRLKPSLEDDGSTALGIGLRRRTILPLLGTVVQEEGKGQLCVSHPSVKGRTARITFNET